MATLFTRIIQGEIPCEKILEDERFFACMDIRPIARGHVLVFPKLEVDQLFELGDDWLQATLPFCKRIAKAQKLAVTCKRIGVMVAGFQVPHAHIHLIPIQHEGDLSFSRARDAKPGELVEMGRLIRENL